MKKSGLKNITEKGKNFLFTSMFIDFISIFYDKSWGYLRVKESLISEKIKEEKPLFFLLFILYDHKLTFSVFFHTSIKVLLKI